MITIPASDQAESAFQKYLRSSGLPTKAVLDNKDKLSIDTKLFTNKERERQTDAHTIRQKDKSNEKINRQKDSHSD